MDILNFGQSQTNFRCVSSIFKVKKKINGVRVGNTIINGVRILSVKEMDS